MESWIHKHLKDIDGVIGELLDLSRKTYRLEEKIGTVKENLIELEESFAEHIEDDKLRINVRKRREENANN